MKNNAVISPVKQAVAAGLAFCLMITSMPNDNRQYYEDCYNALPRIVQKKKRKKTVKRFR